ncbi:DUF222 domain-containing protein, partial [Amycolatopsis jejuensis]|uniref:DUF222 domain-containing protein n=1 Tax=Amycolatopsis jejuensis TaxID=330084 RepID=UPI0012E08ABB
TDRDRNIVYARHLELIREMTDRGVVPEGHPSTAVFLATALHVTPREARSRVAQATADLPLTRKAAAAGGVSAQHVSVITEGLAAVPDWLAAEDYIAAEDTLV